MEMSHKFGFVCLSIRMQCKTSGSSVFPNFFYEVRHHKVKEVTDPGFFKKNSDGHGGLTKSQKWPKIEVFRVPMVS